MAAESTPPTAHVSTPSGRVVGIPEGTRLVFGRGPDADLVIPAGRGLSRRAGAITAVTGGAWVANISFTHALYAKATGTGSGCRAWTGGTSRREGGFCGKAAR